MGDAKVASAVRRRVSTVALVVAVFVGLVAPPSAEAARPRYRHVRGEILFGASEYAYEYSEAATVARCLWSDDPRLNGTVGYVIPLRRDEADGRTGWRLRELPKWHTMPVGFFRDGDPCDGGGSSPIEHKDATFYDGRGTVPRGARYAVVVLEGGFRICPFLGVLPIFVLLLVPIPCVPVPSAVPPSYSYPRSFEFRIGGPALPPRRAS